MFERFFLGHPRSVGESYGEHFLMALSFAVNMLAGGIILLIHAVIPGMFVRNGSQIIDKLYDRMIKNRAKAMHDMCEEQSVK